MDSETGKSINPQVVGLFFFTYTHYGNFRITKYIPD